jgi:hypothetical protein
VSEDNYMDDLIAEFDHVDDPDVLERVKTNPALADALQMTRPENWWGTGLRPKVLVEIARDDGIPVVWVPPSKVLLDLAETPDHSARMVVLLRRKQEILDNCKSITSYCDDPWVADASVLTRKAIVAYEAAMALAVSVGEPLAIWASTPRWQFFKSEAAKERWEQYRKQRNKYTWAAFELSDAKANLTYHDDWLYKALIAPIPLFFTEWFPDKGQQLPESLSY